MRKYIGFIASISLMVFLTGCVSQSAELSSEAKANIHTVYVNPQISVPSTIVYSGSYMPNLPTLPVLLISQGLSYASQTSTREAIVGAMNQRNIKINQLLYQSFIKELSNQTNFKVVQNQPYDAQFKLEILSYGFSNSLQNKQALPFVNVDAKLINLSGKVVWELQKEVYLEDNECVAPKVEDYIQNKELMQKMFSALFSETSSELVEALIY